MNQTRNDRHTVGQTPRNAFLIGIVAALLMTATMVVLRLTTGTPTLPEILGEAIIWLMPAAVFSTILDTMQQAAKPVLYVGIFVGMLLVGGLLGRGFAFGALIWSRALQLAAVLWAVFGLVLFPLMGVGLFGSVGLRTGPVALAIQHALVFGSFATALLLLLRAAEPAQAAPVLSRRRRAAVASVAGGLALVAVGGTFWRMLLGSAPPVSTANTGPVASGVEDGATAASGTAGTPAPEGAAVAGSGAVAAAPGAPADGAGPVRGVPPLNAPSVPMTVLANQPSPPPFNVPKLSPEVLAPKDFYTVSKNLIDPVVHGNAWSLRVDGLVENPATYVYADITALPTFSDYYSLQCISNPVGGELFGNAHWKGVRMVELLSRAGLRAGIRKVVFHAEDGYTDSIPLDVALRPDTLLAYEMNGEQLPKEHGFPARLLVPDIYGMKNVKWITRIELVDYDFKGYWMQRGWGDAAIYRTSTRIDVPANRAQLPAGDVVLGGVTFAGFRGIQKVEVSLDDGKTWEVGTLKPALSLNAWNLWVFRKTLPTGTYNVKARAVDGNGDVQTQTENDPLPDGATGYHSLVLRVG
jgi:DMSO/TMAO reductase YedYZ molybdopterin-dependent catalytic subunit